LHVSIRGDFYDLFHFFLDGFFYRASYRAGLGLVVLKGEKISLQDPRVNEESCHGRGHEKIARGNDTSVRLGKRRRKRVPTAKFQASCF
ncbi:MAG: hypothetical protein JW891_04310, partial [Candidatus Lokiarchaeota archaeon]|nr:hypothetical protein [Candidatus Lokiarchaeota archaeon]